MGAFAGGRLHRIGLLARRGDRHASRPQAGRIYLAVTPAEPIMAGQQVSLVIRGLLDTENVDVQAPDIAPLNFDAPLRYVAVPRYDESQLLAWRINGLQAVRWPAPFASGPAEAVDDVDYYRVTSSPFRAVQVREESLAGVTRVYWAEHRLAWNASRTQALGISSFLVDPGDRMALHLGVNKRLRVLSVRVDDRPAIAADVGGERWQVQLRASQLPQRVDLIHVQSFKPAETLQAARPYVEDAPVEQSGVTLAAPPGFQVQPRWANPDRANQRRMYLARWNAALTSLEDSADHLRRRSQDVRGAWYESWAGHSELHRRFALASRLAVGEVATLRSLQDGQREWAQQLDTADWQTAAEQSPLVHGDPVYLWEYAAASQTQVSVMQAGGGQGMLRVRLSALVADDAFLLRMLVAATLAASVWMLSRIGPWGRIEDIILRSPFVLLVLLGGLWWLVFQPSPAGWVLILIAVGGALRFPWPRRFD